MENASPLVKQIARVRLPTEAETAALGQRLAVLVRQGDCILLEGDLGTGKTSLAQALIRAASGEDLEVPSPTYTLVQTYACGAFTITHFDLYRLRNESELDEIGWQEARYGSVVLVEWPERLGGQRPLDGLTIALSHEGVGRAATLAGGEHWRKRLGVFA